MNQEQVFFSTATTVLNTLLVLFLPKLKQKYKDRFLDLRNHRVIRLLSDLESSILLFKSTTPTKTKLIQDWKSDGLTFLWAFVVDIVQNERKYMSLPREKFIAELGASYTKTFTEYQKFMVEHYPAIVCKKFFALSRFGRIYMRKSFEAALKSGHSKKRIIWLVFDAVAAYIEDTPNLLLDYHNTNGEFKDVIYKGEKIC